MHDLPERTADTMSMAIALSSPSGRMSKRARKAAEKRLAVALFGEPSSPKPATKTRRTSAAREAMQNEALDRAQNGRPNSNYATIMQEFSARGIALDDIVPRHNVLTFHAWRAVGRQVMKGEKGVQVVTYVPCDRKEKDPKTGEEKIVTSSRPRSATVFHISQTKPMEGGRQ